MPQEHLYHAYLFQRSACCYGIADGSSDYDDVGRDHVLGPPDAEMTLVEYGSYACSQCHAVHEVIERLRSRFGERMRFVFRRLPVAGSEEAARASELAEYAAQTAGRFWEVHEALMERGPAFAEGDFKRIARESNLPPMDGKRHIFWNFVSSSKERIEQATEDWKAGRFTPVPSETEFIPLPESGPVLVRYP